MATVAHFFLPVSPEQARFLTRKEALIAKARGVRQVGDIERVGGVVWRDIGATFLDLKSWLPAVSCPVQSTLGHALDEVSPHFGRR